MAGSGPGPIDYSAIAQTATERWRRYREQHGLGEYAPAGGDTGGKSVLDIAADAENARRADDAWPAGAQGHTDTEGAV